MFWTTTKDKYGRTVHQLHTADFRIVHVVVRLPAAAIAAGSDPYLSNDWTMRGDAAVRFHQSLADAKAWALASH